MRQVLTAGTEVLEREGRTEEARVARAAALATLQALGGGPAEGIAVGARGESSPSRQKAEPHECGALTSK